jgi:GntR family transcriptional regulator
MQKLHFTNRDIRISIDNTDSTGRGGSMFELDVRSRTPIYEQLMDQCKQLIVNNVMKPDEKLPSVRELAKQLTVNPNTIQKAYRELERQQFIYSIPGRGSFVTPQSEIYVHKRTESMKEELKALLSEALHLGLGKEELISLIEETEQALKGGKTHD